jgi:hypothetical protein
MDLDDKEKARDRLKPRAPVKNLGADLDLKRLSLANPAVFDVVMSKTGDNPEARQKEFHFWFDQETRALAGKDVLEARKEARSLVLNRKNPLLAADSFLQMSTVEEMRIEDDKAKSRLVNEAPPPPPPVSKKAVSHLTYILFVTGGLLLFAYMYGKMGVGIN